MSFKKKEIDSLLAATGRRCCLCGSLHNVQVHHIILKKHGGLDEINNAITLCPSCHDRVHVKASSGHTTRDYSPEELRLHRDKMISLQNKNKKNTFKFTEEKDNLNNNPLKLANVITMGISLSKSAENDCFKLNVKENEIYDFVKGEFERHPLMFSYAFTSLPLIFGENVLILSWNNINLLIERILYRHEAYPLNDLWSSCLGLYRKATLLPYRNQSTNQLIISSEANRTLQLFKKLVVEIQKYVNEYKTYTGIIIDLQQDFQYLIDEAESALNNSDIGIGIARLEALLSIIHKLIISNAPQGREGGVHKKNLPTPPKIKLLEQGKPTVLIVDDEEIVRYCLERICKKEGYQYQSVVCAREAMQLLVEKDFDIIFIDLLMPDSCDGLFSMDGRELALAARNSGSRAKLILMTGYFRMADKSEVGTDKFPCDYYILKPLRPDQILSILKETLGNNIPKKPNC